MACMEPEPFETPITRMTDHLGRHPNSELHELLALLNADNEAMLAKEHAVAAAVLELQRLTVRKLRILEQLTTTLTGIHSDGSEVD